MQRFQISRPSNRFKSSGARVERFEMRRLGCAGLPDVERAEQAGTRRGLGPVEILVNDGVVETGSGRLRSDFETLAQTLKIVRELTVKISEARFQLRFQT